MIFTKYWGDISTSVSHLKFSGGSVPRCPLGLRQCVCISLSTEAWYCFAMPTLMDLCWTRYSIDRLLSAPISWLQCGLPQLHITHSAPCATVVNRQPNVCLASSTVVCKLRSAKIIRWASESFVSHRQVSTSFKLAAILHATNSLARFLRAD